MESSSSSIGFYFWLFCVCCSLAGVQFVYSIQFAVGTPLFNQELKIEPSIVSIILSTAGPISGFIVQPIVGVISDSSTNRFGRRRPFILAGTLICAVGMAVIGNAVYIGQLLGDHEEGTTPSDHKFAIIFAVIGLWVMNVCVNVVQGPARAIIADIVPEDKQQTGNAMASGVMGLSAIIANIVGAQFFGKPQPYRFLFLIGVAFVILAVIPTMIAAKEIQFVRSPGSPKNTIGGVFVKIFRGFRNMPGRLLRVAFVYFLSWCAYSPFMIYISAYFAVNVYHGDAINNVPLYQHGIKIAMYSLAIFAAVQWFYSLAIPPMIKLTNIKFVYFSSQLVATACYFLFLFFPSPLVVVFILTAFIAPNFTTFNSIPFALIGAENKDEAGLYMGVLNSAAVIAQTVTNSIAGLILNYKGENVAWGIAFGGCISILACAFVFALQTPKEESKDERAGMPYLYK